MFRQPTPDFGIALSEFDANAFFRIVRA